MAAYQLIEPSIEKLTQLSYITYQLRYYEKLFKAYKDAKDEAKANEFREHLDNWHKDNLEQVK